jgi:hypothetical protein
MPSIISALVILAANGLQAAAADGADAADTNGWAARATFADDGASTFEPANIILQVQDYGHDAAGNLLAPGLGGPVRTVTGRKVLRRQWANQLQRLNSAPGGVGTTRTVYFSLSDVIYQNSVVTASAVLGYYGAAAAGSIDNVTNSSQRVYPKPTFAWLNAQHDRATAANLYVEAVAYHRWARNGRQVACIKYQAQDAQATPNLTPEVTVSAPTLSTLCKQGQVPECFAANLAQAALTNGDLCRVNAKVYPWLGDASAVLNLLTDGVAVTGNWSQADLQTPLRFVCDRTGAYGGAIAYVRPTGTLAGTSTAGVFTAPQTGLTDAQCYAAVSAAAQAIETWSGVNKGHADVGGHTAYLTDDGAGGPTNFVALNHSRTAGKCWFDIRRDPNAVGATTVTLSTTQSIGSLTRISHNLAHTALNGIDGANSAGRILGFEDMTIDQTGSPATPTAYRTPLVVARNLTVINPRGDFWAGFNGTDQTRFSLILGAIVDQIATNCIVARGNAVIGGRFRQTSITMGVDKFIIANNRFQKIVDNVLKELGNQPLTSFAIVQNVWEAARPTNAGALLSISADNIIQGLDGGVMMYNVFPDTGRTGRVNIGYVDDQNTGTGGTAAGVIKRIHLRYNIFGQLNTKSDTFASGSQGGSAANTGRTGNWSIRYHVGDEGNVVYSSNQTGDIAPDENGGSWLGEQWNPSNVFHQAVTYTNPQSSEGGAGLGDYTLAGSSNPAYDRVPAGMAALTYDLNAVLRRNDGTGAAGPYERTDNAPVAGAGGGTIGNVGETGAGKVPVQGGGGGTLGQVGESGTGGAPPAAGGGGGTIGNVGGGGAGAVTDRPITAKGDIIASAQRVLAVQPVPAGSSASLALPLNASVWTAPYDPSDRVPFAIDWSALLAEGETIEQIDKITMSAQGVSLGIRVDSDPGREPIISTDGKRTQIWLRCDAAFQSNAAFAGSGVQVGIAQLIRTDADPYKQYERTAVVNVRQQ